MEFKPEKPSLETIGPNEAKKGVMEKAQDERLKLKFDTFKKVLKLVLHGIEGLTPVGNFKMGAEAIRGKKYFTDEKLSKKDRIMYGLIVLHSSIYTTLAIYGVLKGNENAVMLSAPIYAITAYYRGKEKSGKKRYTGICKKIWRFSKRTAYGF